MLKAHNIIVKGNVRGVGYRRIVQQRAWKYEIVGAVRNMKDGTVQITAQGEDYNLKSF